MARTFLTKQQRFVLIKFLALLSLVRWYNILLIVLSQYLTAIFILNSNESVLSIVLDYRLLLIALSSALIIAAGYIINSFYDLEKDLINQPKKIIFEKYISKWFSLNCYFLFNFLGLLASYFAGWKILVFNASFLFILWLYSHKLKKMTFIGNLSATILSIIPFFSVCLFYNEINIVILVYVSFIFLLEFTRVIIKDMEAIKGDVIFGYYTLPVTFGINKTKRFAYFLMALTFVPPALLVVNFNNIYMTSYFGISAGLVLISVLKLVRGETAKSFHQINNIYKAILLLGIGSIIFF